MGPKNTSPSKTSNSFAQHSTLTASYETNPAKKTQLKNPPSKKQYKSSKFLQSDLQTTRDQMINAWVNLMRKTLGKKKGKGQGEGKDERGEVWGETWRRVEEGIGKMDRGCYWRVFEMIEGLSSREEVEMRGREIGEKEEGRGRMAGLEERGKAKGTFIDITSMSKRVSKVAKQNPKQDQKIGNKFRPSPEIVDSPFPSHNETKLHLSTLLQTEFNSPHHPFSLIKSIFISSTRKLYTSPSLLPLSSSPSPSTQNQQILKLIHDDLRQIISYLLKSSQIYKPPTMYLLSLKQKGYNKYMTKTLINFLFSTPDLHSLYLPPLRLSNHLYIKTLTSPLKQNISISKFNIKKELEIEGNYVKSMLMLSDIHLVTSPKHLLGFFSQLKTQIELDIQFFNKTIRGNKEGEGEENVIDGDNLLSIICYMLCKMKGKVGEIHGQLMVLKGVYGEGALVEYDSASYMVTAMFVALEYLGSEEGRREIEGG